MKPKIFWCWTLNSGTSYYRMINYIKYMQEDTQPAFSKWKPSMQETADWEYKLDQPEVLKDLAFLIDECDMIIAQKFHWHGGLSVLDALLDKYPKKKFYTELDDNIFAVNESQPAYECYHLGSEYVGIVQEQICRSHGLIVSTDNLRREMEVLNPNVWVVPNGIDFKVWDNLKKPKKKKKRLRIGWAGGGTHITDLDFIKEPILNIIKNFDVEFIFLGGVPEGLKPSSKIKLIRKWFPIDRYPQELADMDLDIAIAPLRDNRFNRAKSNLRWLEYSALGIPTIASKVEPFKCINDKKDGILVVEKDEWENALADLICEEGMREEIGKNAYDRVKKEFNVENIAKDYVKKINKMLKGEKNVSIDEILRSTSGRR